MRRHAVRSLSVLLIILLLALGSTSAPVSAGSMTGAGFTVLLGQPAGTCAVGQTPEGHWYLLTVIGAPIAPINPNNHSKSQLNILVNGPYANMPDNVGACTPVNPI